MYINNHSTEIKGSNYKDFFFSSIHGYSLGSAGNNHIHPAIIKLGVQYAKGIICGSNARCVALLLAFKKVSPYIDAINPPLLI